MPKNIKIKVYNDFALCENERKVVLDYSFPENIELEAHLNKKIIRKLIHQVKSNGPAGLLHASILSKILRRQIRIWQNDRIVYVFEKSNGKPEIDVEFKHGSKRNSLFGHWTLRKGNSPTVSSSNKNDCFYEVIASQTGIDPKDLRYKIARVIRKYQQSILKSVLNTVDPQANINSMLGGASYTGTSERNAQILLDKSQNGECHPERSSGHPRGHASHSSARNFKDSIELYSYSRWRSGFLSRSDQDLVVHYSLITNSAQEVMYYLNNGSIKSSAYIQRNEIDYDPLPNAQIWSNGQPQGSPGNFSTVCLVGKHFYNQQKNVNADIFILTFYPIL